MNYSKLANTRFVDHRAKAEFIATFLYQFLRTILSENVAMAQAFSKTFDGEKVRIGSQTFKITETIIARATQTLATYES